MDTKLVIIGTIIVGGLLVILYAYRSHVGYGEPTNRTNILQRAWAALYNKRGGSTRMTSSSSATTTQRPWWNNQQQQQMMPVRNSYLDSVRANISKVVGTGAADALVMTSSNDVITQDDITNYVTEYDRITDDGVIGTIDPADTYDISSDFNDPNNTIITGDDTPYNLYANPDDNNYEVITSKQLYEQSEYPSIIDQPFQSQEVTYSLDDISNNTYAIPRDSINNSENIDPSLTDGVVYYPDNTDVNNQNLFDLIRTSIDDRINTTQSVYLENSVMDDSVFSIS